VSCSSLVLFASTTVCCTGRPATRYRSKRGPLPRVPTDLDVPYPIPSYPPGQGMGYAKGYVPGYGVKHTLHYSFVLVFYECTFHHTLGPGYGEHTLWRRVHTLIPGYIPGYGTSKPTEVQGSKRALGARVSPRDHQSIKSIKGPHKAARGQKRSHIPAPPQGAATPASHEVMQAWGAVNESQ